MQKTSKKALFVALAIILAITALGILGYYYGFLGFIYNVALPKAMGNFNLIVLAMIFGVAAFFSPCAISVLPAYVSHYLSTGDQETTTKIGRLLYLGLLGALGIILVNMVIGLVIAVLGNAAPFEKDPRDDIALVLGVRIAVGAIITLLGIMTISGKRLRIPFAQHLLSKASFDQSIFYYGIFYNTAAIGCTGPILLGLILFALSAWSFAGAITVFVVFSLTMGVLMIITTVLIGLFKGTLVRKMMTALPVIEKIAGATMIFIGLALVILTLEGNNLFVEWFFPYLLE